MLAIVIGWVLLLRLSVGKRSDRILKSIFLKQREYPSVHSCSSETPEPMVLEKIIEISDRISFKTFFSSAFDQAEMKEDTIQHLASEMDELQEQHRDVLSKVC